MRIWRVEHPASGNGPYNHAYHTSLCDTIKNAHGDCRVYPSKSLEFPGTGYEWYCCFDSLECLYIWFEGFGAALDVDGFVIAVYEVPDLCVRHGKAQSIFIKDRATLVDTFPTTNIPERI